VQLGAAALGITDCGAAAAAADREAAKEADSQVRHTERDQLGIGVHGLRPAGTESAGSEHIVK
jgi:hypothetical protein